jgi:hypothetical protein
MSASAGWTVDQLTPLMDLLTQIVPDQRDILDMAERAGCKSVGNIPKRDTAEGQWQEAIKTAIKGDYLEELMLEAQARAAGDSGEDFRNRLQKVVARRLIGLVGVDYAKLRSQLATLLKAEEPTGQLEAAITIRDTVLKLREELDDNISWQALTLLKTSLAEIQELRDRLVVICLNIVSASDYMIAMIRPLSIPGTPSDPEDQRMYLTDRGRVKTGLSDDEDKQLRRIVDARITLAMEVRRFWLTLKESVTLPPTS